MRYFLGVIALTLGLAGAGLADTQDLILPVAINGYVKAPVHYQTTIRLVNLQGSPVQVTLEAYRSDGTAVRILELFPVPKTGTKTVFNLDAYGSVEAFTAEDVPDINGWIRLTFDATASIQATAEISLINAPVGPQPICSRPSTDILTTVEVASVHPAKKFGGIAVIRPNRTTGYAVVNPSPDQSVTTFLSLFDPAAKFVGSATIMIPPQGRVSRMLSEYFPGVAADLMGSLRVTATGPVGVGAVHVLSPEGKYVSVPVEAIPAQVCAQVVTPARNPLTSECRAFPTPCDIPEGWLIGCPPQ